jgi:anti-sigma factor RsiW
MSDSPHNYCTEGGKGVSCRDCADFLMDYLDGTLPAEEQSRFQVHLERCRDCRVYMENYKKTVAITCAEGKATCEQAKELPIPKRLVEAILEARKKSC